MGNPTALRDEIASVINDIGTIVRIKYYGITDTGSGYDDSYKFVQSGTDIWTSGAQQPIKGATDSYEARLLEQGKLTTNDSRLFLPGDTVTSGVAIKIGLGSPVTREFSIIDDGIEAWPVNNVITYKKAFIRMLPTGSLDKE